MNMVNHIFYVKYYCQTAKFQEEPIEDVIDGNIKNEEIYEPSGEEFTRRNVTFNSKEDITLIEVEGKQR